MGWSGHFLFILCHCNPTAHSPTCTVDMHLQRTAWNVAFHQMNQIVWEITVNWDILRKPIWNLCRSCRKYCTVENTIHVLPYTFTVHVYHTCFTVHIYHTCSTVHVLPYMFSETSDRNWNCKGVKLPSGCVVPGSWSFHTFGCCFVNWWGGLMRWTISWGEHHARLVQGLWNWQVWAASPPATFVLHLEFRVQFWLLHSCVQFVVSADWEAQGKRVPSP